jgi:serine/threonine protein kinase
MLSADTILQGRYRIVRQLGQGGMGAVYEAVDERLDTIVALKETLFTEEKLRKQFEREARLLARMHHPALTRVSDHFNEGEGQFLVMQYIAGEDLAEMLSAQAKPFAETEVIRWADQLCDALDYLHTQDPPIIHRDIKPQNLKLTARGQVVLLDFGLAKGSAGQLTAVTTSASIFGYTPNYAPLEQVQGMGTDARSDIYSLAATLFHLVTNVKPPDALSRAAAVVNGEADPLPPANQLNAIVGAAFANVLHKGMSLKRDDRFATASAMREALRVAAEHPSAETETLVTASSGANFANSATVTSERQTRLMSNQTQRGTPSIGSEAKTLVAGEETNLRGATPAALTAMRSKQRATWQPWALAAILLVVVCAGVAGFYALRARRQAQQTTAQPAPAETQPLQTNVPLNSNSAAPANSPNELPKTTEVRNERPRSETGSQRGKKSVPQQEQNAETPAAAAARPNEPAHDPNREPNRGDPNRARNGVPFPTNDQFDPFRGPGAKQPGHPPNMPEIRTMPNGTRVIKQPDGSFIFVGPKGNTRIVPPPGGRRNNRNANQP